MDNPLKYFAELRDPRLTFRRSQFQYPRNYPGAGSGVSGQFGVDEPLCFLLPVE